jgi:DNA polymerase-3 subunit gamma/tau
VSGPVAINTKPVAPIYGKVPQPSGEARLDIEVPPPAKEPATKAPAAKVAAPAPAVKAPEPVKAPAPSPMPATASAPQGNGGKMSLREKLMQEQLQKKQQQNVVETREPVLDEVMEIWGQMRDQLKAQAKHGAVTSMNLASVRLDGLTVVIKSVSLLNQKFLETEFATEFTEGLRQRFHNQRVHLKFEVDESAVEQPKDLEPKYLNATERLKLMAEQYPLVLELKERLKLDLGF